MSVNRGVRVGAVAFALGLSLAGPQAVGVAAADGGDADSSSVSVDQPDTSGQAASNAPQPRTAQRGAVARAARSAADASRAAGTGTGATREVATENNPAPLIAETNVRAGVGRGIAQRRPAATTAEPTAPSPAGPSPAAPSPAVQPALAAVIGPAAADRISAAVAPVVASVAAGPASVPVAASAAAARVAAVTARPVAVPVAQVVSSVGFSVERFLDSVGQWLSGLPGGPITEVLAGGLWLVRRTLFPVGSGVGLWGTAACVATKDCSGQDLTGADFRNQDLTAVRFTDANLTRAYFGGANLTRADFTGAGLLQTELSNTNLTDANLSGADLKYQDLRGVTLDGANLTNANLIGARLAGRTAAGLATATLVGANFTGQRFDSGNLAGTTLKWAGKDLTGVNLSGANMTGADLTRANLTGAQMAGVNLTRANLTDAVLPGPSFASPLVTATLVGANLTNVDLSGADLSRMDLTGTVLAGANLARTKLKSTNLTGANLTDAILTGADLTGANLTRADLLRADILNTTLTSVVWRDTRCQYGSKTSSGCSNVALLDQPPADWLQTAYDRRPGLGKFWPWQWYQYGGPGVEPALGQHPSPIVRGTPGAPLWNSQFRDSADYPKYPEDGAQGMIYNDSEQRVVVRVPIPFKNGYYWSTAVLDPGDKVSYQFGEFLESGNKFFPISSLYGGTVQFLRYDNGQTAGGAAQLDLWDPDGGGGPVTAFTPPGVTDPVNIRRDWKQEGQASELWGDVNIQVRREIDGWNPTGSETWRKYYRYTGAASTSDWAIFTIRIKGL